MKEVEFILWKLNFIPMKILSDIACNLNSDFYQNSTKLKRNGMQIGAKGIENLFVTINRKFVFCRMSYATTRVTCCNIFLFNVKCVVA
jgi:hypothetical protein